MIQVLAAIATVSVIFLLISYIMFRIVFYVPPRKTSAAQKLILPPGKIYEPFYDQMRSWALETRNTPHEDVSITSLDGLRLTGKYYEYAPGAPIELMFHGYRGNAERDLSGGLHRCFQLGHSALIVDQRCSGTSEGNVITFGIHEHRDCLSWINFMLTHFGTDIRIILTGISMGASTVLIASGMDLPKNVIGILADCGFHSAKDVICSVARSMHLPYKILYPFVKFAASIYGHFDLEEFSAVEAVRDSKVPILFFHGLDDDYVPYYMSQLNYEACASRKKLVLIPGAGHGLSFPVAPETYLDEMRNFFDVEE